MDSTANSGNREQTRPLYVRILSSPIALLTMLLGAALSAILIEWFGMVFDIWTLPGSEHARQTLIQDISYLNKDFPTTLFAQSPTELAANGAKTVSIYLSELINKMNPQNLYQELRSLFGGLPLSLPSSLTSKETQLSSEVQATLLTLSHYVDSALFSIQTIVVRVIVATLTIPTYLLIGVACLMDGLVARDLRKYKAGNESSFAYHRFRPWAKRFFVLSWYLYIAWPGPIHPNLIFIPSATLYGLAIFHSAKWFKKFI